MKNTKSEILAGSVLFEGKNLSVSYGDLLSHTRIRRREELEEAHPDRSSNVNAVSNTTRSLTAFMQANGLNETTQVGTELTNKTTFDQFAKSLGTDSTARRRKGELNVRVRAWATELVQLANDEFNDESFGARLSRLRGAAKLTTGDLARAIVHNRKQADLTKIRAWEKGKKIPSPASYEDIRTLESFLSVPSGYLLKALPKGLNKSKSQETGLPPSVQRRVSPHLPQHFDSLSLAQKDEILAWVSKNILSTPKEILEDQLSRPTGAEVDVSIYAFSRSSGGRLEIAPPSLITELDDILDFKTNALVPSGKQRGAKWAKVTAEKSDYELRAFLGALYQIGLPKSLISLSICLSPESIDKFIEWKRKRRGGYTRAIEIPLILLETFLHPWKGVIAQTKDFGASLVPVPGLISKDTVERVRNDWDAACVHARTHIKQRLKDLSEASKKGRDPFESILTAIETENPLEKYYTIVSEIRKRIPDSTYPVRRAEALRSLLMFRLGLSLVFRQKNLRELLLAKEDEQPRSWKQLKLLKRGEISFSSQNGWEVRIPGNAFKNYYSTAVHDENTLPIADHDDLYSEIDAYIAARSILTKGNDEPDEFFVKTMTQKSKSGAYNSAAYYNAFRAIITTYGIHNPYTGRGAIAGLRPHGPHSIRHIVATTAVKKTGGYSDAAALLFDSEEMIRETYARFLPAERHARAQNILWADIGGGNS